MNRPQKPASALQGHRTVDVLPALSDLNIPEPPPNLLPETMAAWQRFWGDVPSRVVVMSDWTKLLLCFQELDEYHRCMARYRGNGRGRRLQRGSKGQMVRSPWFDMAQGHLRAFLTISEPFGMDPGSRLRYRIGTIASRPGQEPETELLEAMRAEIEDEPDELPEGYIPEDDDP